MSFASPPEPATTLSRDGGTSAHALERDTDDQGLPGSAANSGTQGSGRGPDKAGLVVVANRLPVRRSGGQWVRSPGGLVSAVTPILGSRHGTWVGWTGEADDDPGTFALDGVNHVSVPLSGEEISDYYSGMANATLWPLFHDAVRTPEICERWWTTYKAVNSRFAEAALRAIDRSGRIWVHDYHLLLVPGLIKGVEPERETHLFLHIPFPPVELFARLPWRGDIIAGMLAADVVGFQTRRSASNFTEAAMAFSGATLASEGLVTASGRTRIVTSPISVDVAEFERIAASTATRRLVGQLRRELGNPEVIFLGADRLDYTKGIEARLRAFEKLLDDRPYLGDKARFVQIAVPSRETIGDYERTREEIERLAGRIDGKHGSHLGTPVRYVYDSLSREELVAYYSVADVMAVTPLADGMNLVSKEFVASRIDGDGVLLLSEFAGSADELTDALAVNPYDISGMAEQMYRATKMSPEERTSRMLSMRQVVTRNDLAAWTRRALGPLRESEA